MQRIRSPRPTPLLAALVAMLLLTRQSPLLTGQSLPGAVSEPGAETVSSARTSTLSGHVRSAEGIPLEGVHITLSGIAAPSVSTQTLTDKSGKFSFLAVREGAYHLAATLDGYAQATHTAAMNPASPVRENIDFTLSRLPAGEWTQSASHSAPPQFETAGVRGLIDPGGYSAPANAAAASGLIQGMATLKRSENNSNSPQRTDSSCAMDLTLELTLEKAEQSNPNSADANRRLGQFYLAQGQAAAAVPPLERSHLLDSSNPDTVLDLAEAWVQSGQFDSAQKLLTSPAAQKIGPRVHPLLARAEEGLGQFANASQQYKLASEQNPTEKNLFGIGYEQILDGHPAQAESAFQSGLTQYPRSVQLQVGVATTEFLLGHSAAAVHACLQAIALNPTDPRPYPFLAEASEVSPAEAESVHAAFQHYLQLEPENAQANYFFARNRMHQTEQESATDQPQIEGLLKTAIRQDPKFAKAHFQLGIVYSQLGEYENAATEFRTTLLLDSGFNEAHYRLASAYRHTGQNELATKELHLFLKSSPHAATHTGEAKTSIVQFISVLEPQAQPGTKPTPCNPIPHSASQQAQTQ